MSQVFTEIDEDQLHQLAKMEIGRAAILFTTPFCGTCKLATRMIEIAYEAGIQYPLYKANINFMPYYREAWKIKSIPCLVLIQHGKVQEHIYAISSVDEIYLKLKD